MSPSKIITYSKSLAIPFFGHYIFSKVVRIGYLWSRLTQAATSFQVVVLHKSPLPALVPASSNFLPVLCQRIIQVTHVRRVMVNSSRRSFVRALIRVVGVVMCISDGGKTRPEPARIDVRRGHINQCACVRGERTHRVRVRQRERTRSWQPPGMEQTRAVIIVVRPSIQERRSCPRPRTPLDWCLVHRLSKGCMRVSVNRVTRIAGRYIVATCLSVNQRAAQQRHNGQLDVPVRTGNRKRLPMHS